MDSIQKIEKVLSEHFLPLKDRLTSFTKTGYSFEEWFNWECTFAFNSRDIKCQPKPNYRNFGEYSEKKQGDFLLEINNEKVFVEVKLVHDYTSDKWKKEIEKDANALMTIDKAKPLMLLLISSEYEDVMRVDDWSNFLTGISFWEKACCIDIDLNNNNSGQKNIKGWEFTSA